MIRSTRHHIKDLNVGKTSNYQRFILEYSDLCKQIVSQIWQRLPEDLSLPSYYDYKSFDLKTTLSARVLSSATTQAAGIVKASIEKQRRRLWYKKVHNPDAKDIPFVEPSIDFIAPNLSSKCANFQASNGKFSGFIKLSSLGAGYRPILVPIIGNPRSAGKMLGGFILFKKTLQIAWEIEKFPRPQGDKVLGLDQGYKTVVTLSDGQSTPETCPHGHSLESVISKMSRKKKGSKSFKRAQAHRKNFVNWSINQLDFSNTKEVRIEKIVNIRKGVRTSRSMSHWSNPEIRDKIKRRCEELEVPVVEQSCAYRSQRCSCCGQVRRANRKKKLYDCKNCGFTCDSDLNAARNHEADLPPVPRAFLGSKRNLGNGFFWKPTGFFEFSGAEIRVPCS